MNVLLLCGYCEPAVLDETVACGKAGIEHAANQFQQRLIQGLRSQDCLVHVVSAPFIGAWPNRSSTVYFKGFQTPSCENIEYVRFHNLWGWRNISRSWSLRGPVKRFLNATQGTRRAVIVYAPHTPFLEAAIWARRAASDLHICLIVPDLPQYMNPSDHPNPFYRFCKWFDIRRFHYLNQQVDSYWLLTEPMADALRVNGRPYLVMEGIAAEREAAVPTARGKTFVYAGKLMRRFGVGRLMEAFSRIDDPECRLVLCGAGEMEEEVRTAADGRIRYAGVLTPPEVQQLFCSADALISPRTGQEAYTRYSFPSKIIEYLQTGLPVVSARLAGMPEIYERFLQVPADDSVSALRSAMCCVLQADAQAEQARVQAVNQYMRTLSPSDAAARLLAMMETVR